MPKIKKEINAAHEILLAPYAIHNKDSKGRAHPEEEHPYRSLFERDRDRIIHSQAFRKLEYKTQVFLIIEGDYYRTRLTHTLEVAGISRTIARALQLNEILTEAISLAHDMGHTPFGHSGEDALSEIMKDHGGFNHNLQSLRVADILEERYPNFKGLNLTWETREGIVKHSSSFDRSVALKEFGRYVSSSLETQVVDIADEIAYDNHDLDDGLTSGLIKEEDLCSIKLWNDIRTKIYRLYPGLRDDILKYQVIRELINLQVSDIITQSKKNLERLKFKSVEEVRNYPKKIIEFSPEMQKSRAPLRKFLMDNLYKNYRVTRMSNKAKRFIKQLFNSYLENPQQLPPAYQNRLKNFKNKHELRHLLCDYIAGMTDTYALDEYKKLFDPYEKV